MAGVGGGAVRRDPELKHALLTVAQHEHSRECLLLLEAILETPGLMPRLTEVSETEEQGTGIRNPRTAERVGTRDQGLSEGQWWEIGGAEMTWEDVLS